MQKDAGNQPRCSRRADVGDKAAIAVLLTTAKGAGCVATDWRTFPPKRQLQCLTGLEGDVAGCEEGKIAWERVVPERPECVVDAAEVVFDHFLHRLCFLVDADALPPLRRDDPWRGVTLELFRSDCTLTIACCELALVAIAASGVRIDRVRAAKEVAQCSPYIWFLAPEYQDGGRDASKCIRQRSQLRQRAIAVCGDDEAGYRVRACQFGVVVGRQRPDVEVGIEDAATFSPKQRVTFARWQVGEVAAAAIT